MDDFSSELLRQMPQALQMKRDGASFTNSFVADSLCCSSRAAILTGMYPHNNGVHTNSTGPDAAHPEGGFAAFQSAHDGTRTFAYSMEQRGAGYKTMFSGKYLNEYRPHDGDPAPPGWNVWNAIGPLGYREYGYGVTRLEPDAAGRELLAKERHGREPGDYLTDVLANNAVRRIGQGERADQPYFLEVATYGTHARTGKPARPGDPLFPPADRDRPSRQNPGGNCGTSTCSSLNVSDLPGFNDDQSDNTPLHADGTPTAPWQANTPMSASTTARYTTSYRDRARMAQSIDRLVGRVRSAVGPNTYVVLTSDNGLHLGQHRMPMGKGTAYEHDVKVPLLVTGPGVRPGPRPQLVNNIDLAPTFEELAGLTPTSDRDGQSLLPYLEHPQTPGPRYTFIEHTQPTPSATDPDSGPGTSRVPSYVAVRSRDALLIRYDLDPGPGIDHGYEFYRGLSQPGVFEQTNVFDRTDPLVQEMAARLAAFVDCADAECRAAAQ